VTKVCVVVHWRRVQKAEGWQHKEVVQSGAEFADMFILSFWLVQLVVCGQNERRQRHNRGEAGVQMRNAWKKCAGRIQSRVQHAMEMPCSATQKS
jgi:hypothetical protein